MSAPAVTQRPNSAKEKTAPQMPPIPNKEDINATWSYLEFGINRVMNHFTSGIDMQSVCLSVATCPGVISLIG